MTPSYAKPLIEKEGYKYCGIIHCWSGDERVAFQFTKEE